jgi:quercetin dioxygenase-like cupin family protein
MEKGRVQKLVELVDYQHGSVVSRQIMKLATGTVTLFAFDAGEGLTEHTTPHDALLHVLEGATAIEIGGRASELKEGEAVILPADVPHAVRAPERFKMLLIMIRA